MKQILVDYPRREEFLQTLVGLSRSKHTIKAYDLDLNDFFAKEGVMEITEKAVQHYMIERSLEGVLPSTITRKVSAICFYCKVFNIPINRTKITRPRLGEKEAPYITDQIFSSGLFKIKTGIHLFRSEEERAFTTLLFVLLFNSGLRVAELLSLTINNICMERKGIIVVGKGNKERFIPIPDSLLDKLTSTPLFFVWLGMLSYITISRMIKKYFGQQYSPHSFRHGYATKLVNSGVSETTLKSVMGHSSYITTLRYIHGNEESIRQEVFSALNRRMLYE